MNIKISKYSAGATIIVIALLVIIFLILSHQKRKYKEISGLYIAAQDTAQIYKNKLGESVTKIGVLQSTNNSYFLALKTKDKLIMELQGLVKSETAKRRDVEVAIVAQTKLIYELRDSLSNTVLSQMITSHGDSLFIWPTYQKIVVNPWISDTIALGKKYFKQSLHITDDFSIVVGDEPDGWFKRKPYAQITNHNIYSTTQDMKVYQKTSVPNKKLKTGLWCFGAGGVVGLLLHLLIK